MHCARTEARRGAKHCPRMGFFLLVDGAISRGIAAWGILLQLQI